MIYFPFVYFIILFVYLRKSRGKFNIASIITLVYVISSFCSILIDKYNLYTTNCLYTDIKLFPTIIYCAIITLVILPFASLNNMKINKIPPLSHNIVIDYIVYFYFSIFLFYVIFLTPDIIRNWSLSQVYSDLKGDFWVGEVKMMSLHGFLGSIAARSFAIVQAALILIPLFFYNLCIRKKNSMYIFMNLTGSFTIILLSILSLERSRIVYWMMTFILCYFVFYNYMKDSVRKGIGLFLLILGGLFTTYIVIMNLRRFSGIYENDSMNLLNYAGQGFINFCYFYENLNMQEFNFHAAFPILSDLICDDWNGTIDWARSISDKTGVNILVFPSFFGILVSYIGTPFACIWCVGYALLCRYFVKRVYEKLTFGYFLICILLALEPLFGIFGHYYGSYYVELYTLIFVSLILYNKSLLNE